MATPINAALCSYGMSGKLFHAPFLHHHSDFNLYGVYERSSHNAKKDYPGIKHFSSLEEMLADTAIELVVVNTPNASHFDYTLKALEAGKHVVVEKPFVPTVAQADALIKAAESAGKKLSVYQNRRFDSDFMTVQQVIAQGRLGEIVEAEIHFDRYKLELSPKLHKETPGQSTGIVYDLGSHIIDQALQLFGVPEAVFADLMITRPSSKVDDYFEIIFYYPGRRVRLKGGYVIKHPVPSYIIHGIEGSFLKERADIQEAALQEGLYKGQQDWGREPADKNGLLHYNTPQGDVIEQVETLPGNYGLYFDKLYNAIRNNNELPVTAHEGRNVIAIIEAAFKSHNEKCVVSLNA